MEFSNFQRSLRKEVKLKKRKTQSPGQARSGSLSLNPLDLMDSLDVDDDVYSDDHFLKRSLLTQGHSWREGSPGRVIGCLALLCVLLLAGNIALIVLYQAAMFPTHDSESQTPQKERPPEVEELRREHEELRSRCHTLAESEKELLETESNYSSLRRDQERLDQDREQLLATERNLRSQLHESRSSFKILRADHEQLLRECESTRTLLDPPGSANRTGPKPTPEERNTSFISLKIDLEDLRRSRADLQKELDKMAAKFQGMRCQEGWRKFHFSCYYVSSTRKNWTESRSDCLERGGDLVVIDSEEEQMFVSELLDVPQNAWIGLTDSLSEGTWIWVSGSRVTVEFWQPGQPNDWTQNQDCGEITRASTNSRGHWNDDGCFSQQCWICEK